MNEVSDQFDFLPLGELHVHLRGAIPASYLGQLLEKYDRREAFDRAPLPFQQFIVRSAKAVEFLQQETSPEPGFLLYSAHDLPEFLSAYLLVGCFIQDLDDFHGLVESVLANFEQQGLQYVEITVSVPEYLGLGFELETMLALLHSAKQGRRLQVNWIVDFVRGLGPDAAEALLERMLQSAYQPFSGITLGGSEDAFPTECFRETYRRARAAGLGLSIHAGEALGPESVREAVELLEVDRVGHGFRAIEDRAVVDLLVERQIPLELCVSGNALTGVVPSLLEHPARRLYEAGIPITINTDDPSFFRTDLRGEYAAFRKLGFSESELREIASNTFRYAFLPQQERERLIEGCLSRDPIPVT